MRSGIAGAASGGIEPPLGGGPAAAQTAAAWPAPASDPSRSEAA